MTLIDIYRKSDGSITHLEMGMLVVSVDEQISVYVESKILSAQNFDVKERVKKIANSFPTKPVRYNIEASFSSWEAVVSDFNNSKRKDSSEYPTLTSDYVIPSGYTVFDKFTVKGSGSKVLLVFLVNKVEHNAMFILSDSKDPKIMQSLVRISEYCRNENLANQGYQASNDALSYFYKKSAKRKDVKEYSTSEASQRFESIISSAIRKEASDVHFIITEDSSFYKYRVRKMLLGKNIDDSELLESVIRHAYGVAPGSLTAIGFNTNIGQRRRVDFIMKESGKIASYRLRLETSPLDGGFKAVFRINPGTSDKINKMSFEAMGYEDSQREQINQALNTKKGSIAFLGETNSGKSTSLTKFLLDFAKNRPHWSIDTLEDPVEFKIDGTCQHDVSLSSVDSTGLNNEEVKSIAWGAKIESLLRQDPDAISVGEINNQITANASVKIHKSGHKTLFTLHAGSTLDAYARLIDLGCKASDICLGGFFDTIIYQSLVQHVCHDCCYDINYLKDQYPIKYNALIKLLGNNVSKVKINKDKGCNNCTFGTSGIGVAAEILRPDVKFNSLMFEGKVVEAQDYWLNEMDCHDGGFEYKGRSFVDIILWKVSKGIVCPLKAEEYLPKPLEYLSRDYNRSTLFSKPTDLRKIK
jgi:type II secretory ATPase GspE/PulE/Tfp pilus assembly ATPase PilB-like protein